MTAAIATLLIGIILGYLGQRSRMCFVGGIRDFILIRDTYLLRGLAAFGITAWVAFPLFSFIAGSPTATFDTADVITIALTVVGGFGVGFVSTLANGCPFRQHVLAAQGVVSSSAYLLGFFGGALVFHLWVGPVLFQFLP